MLVRWLVAGNVCFFDAKAHCLCKTYIYKTVKKDPSLFFHPSTLAILHTQVVNVTVNESHSSEAVTIRIERH